MRAQCVLIRTPGMPVCYLCVCAVYTQLMRLGRPCVASMMMAFDRAVKGRWSTWQVRVLPVCLRRLCSAETPGMPVCCQCVYVVSALPRYYNAWQARVLPARPCR
jgi:hypothetical protein